MKEMAPYGKKLSVMIHILNIHLSFKQYIFSILNILKLKCTSALI